MVGKVAFHNGKITQIKILCVYYHLEKDYLQFLLYTYFPILNALTIGKSSENIANILK